MAGLVLCGGESRRMGRPKAWLEFGGETLLARIVRCVSTVAQPVAVVHRPGQQLPPLPATVLLVQDTHVGQGPLAGMHAGFAALRGAATHALVVSCDVPFVRAAFLARLVEKMYQAAATADAPHVPLACVPVFAGRKHPLVAVYALDLGPQIAALLQQGRLRPAFLLEQIPVHWLYPTDWADVDPQSLSLLNINTPQDYQDALRRAGLAASDTPAS
ncbi:MAG: molybdenum cofactor guanylyltransferase [Gemmatales bacterium]|nr:molybdenum cofactor guanylyltransferase [Gemmatales bacterium]MDW8175650.1 molybdenum cofactor guanylyltransferase [Gemmatales bacterium]